MDRSYSLPLNRTEVLRYVWLASLLIMLLVLTAALIWYAVPPTPVVTIGSLANFPINHEPEKVYAGDLDLWVVHMKDMLLILDAHATTERSWQMRYPVRWVPLNHRYEDPVSGAKFSLTGALIEGPADRDLDRYSYRIVNNMIQVAPWEVIPGTYWGWPQRIKPLLRNNGFCTKSASSEQCSWP